MASATLDRQIVGRHVIYKGSDGTKIQSMAEARRYFKVQNLPFSEDDFDFNPPPEEKIDDPKPVPSSVAALTIQPRRRGRPRKSEGTKLIPNQTSAKTARKELADDLKIIQDSLKDDEPKSALTIDVAPKKRGRPPKKATAQIDGSSVQTKGKADGEQAESAEMSGENADDEASEAVDSKGPQSSASAPGSSTAGDTSKTEQRPIRVRRPNQRYMDLPEEIEGQKKRRRTNSKLSVSSSEERSNVHHRNSNSESGWHPMHSGRNLAVTDIRQLSSPSESWRRTTTKNVYGQNQYHTTSQYTNKMRQMESSKNNTAYGDDSSDYVDEGDLEDFESSEFVEIEEGNAHGYYDDPLPAVLPAGPHSSVEAQRASAGRLPSSMSMVRRGRKPAIEVREQKRVRMMAPLTTAVHAGDNRVVHGIKVSESAATTSSLTDNNGEPRGLSKLQDAAARKSFESEYRGMANRSTDDGAGRSAYSSAIMPLDKRRMQIPFRPQKLRAQPQVSRPPDRGGSTGGQYFYLPPEINNDHCYGKSVATQQEPSNDKVRKQRLIEQNNPPMLDSDPRQRFKQRKGVERRSLAAHESQTPSPPPYHHQRAGNAYHHSYQIDVNFSGDLNATANAAGSGGTRILLNDKLPANILEDEGELCDQTTSVSIE